MSSEKLPDLSRCRVLEDDDGGARIIDYHHVPIATVQTVEDECGRHFSRVVFKPDVAHRIVRALDLAAAVDAFTGSGDDDEA